MDVYSLLKWLKWIGILLWLVGTFRMIRSQKDILRIQTLYAFVVPGFALTYMVGWVMMKRLGVSMGEWWIGTSVLLGLISLGTGFLSAMNYRYLRFWETISLFGILSTGVIMMTKDHTNLVGWIAASILVALCGTFIGRSKVVTSAESQRNVEIQQGFKWVARIEGTTVLVLFLLYIPAKRILQINLDGGTGLIGWTHGVYVLIYVISLTITARALNWSVKRWFLGGLSSFFPFGTFIFEHKVFKEQNSSNDSSTTLD